jgi:diguanylate cyclase (GGDEF)-like protein/PAS domain S-box-containing protein
MGPSVSDEVLTLEERVELIRGLAATSDVTIHCLDMTFRSCPVPASIKELGVVPSVDVLDVGELRDQISPRESAALMGAIGQARRRGAGDCILHIPGEEQPRTVAIVDITESAGVYVSLSGPEIRIPGSTLRATPPRPRRVVHHRNEVAELTWIDPLTKDLLGFEPEEMIGRSALEFIHPDDHDRGIDSWLALLAGEPALRYRVRWRTRDGDWIWLEATHTDRLDSHGFIETELVDVDDEMRALARARAGELRFETLTESLPMGVIHVGPGGTILYVNSWLREFAHFDADDDADSRFASVNQDDRAELGTAFRAAIRTGEATDLDVRVRARRRNDERICRVRVRPVGGDSEGEARTAIASVEDITDSAQLEAQLRHKAMTDDLTGLDNRPALVERLQSCLEEAKATTAIAVLYLDLDGFKMINDGLGHDAGDEVLTKVATRLSGCLRPGDHIARVGGDEFVVIAVACPSAEDAGALADRLIEESGEPIEIDGTDARIGCSVGIALSDPDSPGRADELLTNADLAMYKAKRAGGGRWAVYDQNLRRTMTQTFELQRGILDSLDEDEFSLFLQPLRNLATGRTVGAECLVRWFHPVHGLTGTDQFIPIAEQSGLIVPLGRWILDSACRIAGRASAIGRDDLRISVNVSSRQLAHGGFVDEFFDAIDRHGISPSQMILEVTEAVFVGTDGDAVEMLRTIKRSGCTIALDDFGTGYSSLNQLRLMPASMIKIDGSYVGELEVDTGTKAITQAMVELSSELGLEIIAEGVETPGQLRTLQLMNVELGQGYLLGRPAPEEQFFTGLRQRQLAKFPDFSTDSDADDLVL